MLSHELEQGGVDRRPDGACGGLVARGHLDPVGEHGLRQVAVGAELAHVLDRDHHLEVELLARPRVDELDLTTHAGHEAADLLERPLRGGQADALERPRDDALETLERDRQVSAPLRPGHRVHLVEDQRLDGAQHLATLRGEQQEERLRRGDEDVGRRAQHLLALALRRVARAHPDRQARAHARERAAQVALDVVVERLQRRDVEEAQPFARRLAEAVEAEQEGGQRLSGAGRRLHEHVLAACDRRPGELLRGCRAGEGTLEPGSRLG